MKNSDLGKLEKVDLHGVWGHEASDFTPWLAQKDNIDLLGDAIGMDFDDAQIGVAVGSFEADIRCKDATDDTPVVIENQFGSTNHDHLGKLLTYAAGLKALTVVWVSEKFRDGHSAALNWLNEKTGQDIKFFGVEIELWRIGDSKIAPHFNVVCKPNQWVKTKADTEMSERHRSQLDYWKEFVDLMHTKDSPVLPVQPYHTSYMGFSTGCGGVRLYTSISSTKRRIGVRIRFKQTHNARKYYPVLKAEKEDIQRAIQQAFACEKLLIWQDESGGNSAYINLWREGVEPFEKSQRADQHDWLYRGLCAFHEVFIQRVKRIDLNVLPDDVDDSNGAEAGDEDDEN